MQTRFHLASLDERVAVRRPPRRLLALSAFALAAFGILIALGVWQLNRLSWKNDLTERLTKALTLPPVPYASGGSRDTGEFTRVITSGSFDTAAAVRVWTPTPTPLKPKTRDASGYFLFVPLLLDSGAVFVNRGFMRLAYPPRSPRTIGFDTEPAS